MKSFIIHLQGDTRRQPNVARLLADLPDAEVTAAVAGQDAVAAGLARTRAGDLHVPHYPFALTPGEVGCFLSHRACWRRIVDEGLEYALIVEDDLAIDRVIWPQALGLIAAHAGPDSYIRIPAKDRERPAHVVTQGVTARLFLPRVIGLQTVAQVVGRNAAARLLAKSETIDRPVDTFVQMHRVTGQPVHTILPGGVREMTVALGGSTIQKKTRARDKLAREIRRAIYRARVRSRPQRP